MKQGKLFACAVALLCAHGCASGRRVVLTTLATPPCAAARSVAWVGPGAAGRASVRAEQRHGAREQFPLFHFRC
jgi:hypothetical protein